MMNQTSLKATFLASHVPVSSLLLRPHLLIPYLFVCATLLLVAFTRSKQPQLSVPIPIYKASRIRWIFCAESLLKESYRKYRDRVYQVRGTEGVQLILPQRLVRELKALPEDVLSAREVTEEALQSKYTKFALTRKTELLPSLLRARLSQNLASLAPQLVEELHHIIATEFPACHDWTPVKWHPFALRTIARLSGRAFVGPEINRQERWMDCSIKYAVNVFMAGAKLQLFPNWSRPLAQYLIPDLGRVKRNFAHAKATLKPVVEARTRRREPRPDPNAPDDAIQWLIEALPEEDRADLQAHTSFQLILAAASIHTTHGVLCECMYDLAAHPAVQEQLRGEVVDAFAHAEKGLASISLAGLAKMDSFMKEVQRLRGNLVTFFRKVMKPISLSDGTELPVGARVMVPIVAIAHDERLFPNAEAFDPMRFYRQRQASARPSSRLHFTSVSDAAFNFGVGRHACPGRFFASNEVKLVLARFLLDYNIRLRPGERRPEPFCIVMTKAPNPHAVLEFRRWPPLRIGGEGGCGPVIAAIFKVKREGYVERLVLIVA